MKKLALCFLWLSSIGLLSVCYLAASRMTQKEEESLLLFVNREDKKQKLYVFNASTGEQNFISNLISADAGWLPNGLVWVLDTGEIQDNFYRLRLFDVKTGTEITISDSIFHWGCGEGFNWSSDGRYLAYITGEEPNYLLNIMNLLDGTSYSLPAFDSSLPTWSPEGHYMLLGLHELRLYDAENSVQLLSNTKLPNYSHSYFSPDGRYFAYYEDEASSLTLYELATATSTKLVETLYQIGAWSPSGRYRPSVSNPDTTAYSYYDAETGRLYPINLPTRSHFAAWSVDESHILYYTNFPSDSTNAYPQSLISYELATRTSEIILETSGLIDGVFAKGEWLAIPYSSELPDAAQIQAPTKSLFLTNGEIVIEKDLELARHLSLSNYDKPYIPMDIEWSPDGHWLSVGTLLFDSQSTQFEAMPSEQRSRFWSPNSQYLAFYTGLWNAKTETLENLPLSNDGEIIGWQNSEQRESLVYCGQG